MSSTSRTLQETEHEKRTLCHFPTHCEELCLARGSTSSPQWQHVRVKALPTRAGNNKTARKSTLSLACQSGKAKGWTAREMGFGCHTLKKHDHFCDWFRRNLAEWKGFLSDVPEIRMHSERGCDGMWKERRQRHNLFAVKYLQ